MRTEQQLTTDLVEHLLQQGYILSPEVGLGRIPRSIASWTNSQPENITTFRMLVLFLDYSGMAPASLIYLRNALSAPTRVSRVELINNLGPFGDFIPPDVYGSLNLPWAEVGGVRRTHVMGWLGSQLTRINFGERPPRVAQVGDLVDGRFFLQRGFVSTSGIAHPGNTDRTFTDMSLADVEAIGLSDGPVFNIGRKTKRRAICVLAGYQMQDSVIRAFYKEGFRCVLVEQNTSGWALGQWKSDTHDGHENPVRNLYVFAKDGDVDEVVGGSGKQSVFSCCGAHLTYQNDLTYLAKPGNTTLHFYQKRDGLVLPECNPVHIVGDIWCIICDPKTGAK